MSEQQAGAPRGAAVVLGVGPGLGLSIARRFGRAGHPVAVVSRSARRHTDYLDALRADGVMAVAEVADVFIPDQVAGVIARISEQLGPIEVLYFGPAGSSPADLPVPLDRATGADARHALEVVPAAVDAVAAVLPGMIARRKGVILIPTGLSAVVPMPMLGNLALPSAALRNYALTLNAAVAEHEVFVASLVIGGAILSGDIYQAIAGAAVQGPDDAGPEAQPPAVPALDPDEIAEQAWQLAATRDRAELTFMAAGLPGVPSPS